MPTQCRLIVAVSIRRPEHSSRMTTLLSAMLPQRGISITIVTGRNHRGQRTRSREPRLSTGRRQVSGVPPLHQTARMTSCRISKTTDLHPRDEIHRPHRPSRNMLRRTKLKILRAPTPRFLYERKLPAVYHRSTGCGGVLAPAVRGIGSLCFQNDDGRWLIGLHHDWSCMCVCSGFQPVRVFFSPIATFKVGHGVCGSMYVGIFSSLLFLLLY